MGQDNDTGLDRDNPHHGGHSSAAHNGSGARRAGHSAAIDLDRETIAARAILAALADDIDGDAELAASAVELHTSFVEAVDAALVRLHEVESHMQALALQSQRLGQRAARYEKQQLRIREALRRGLEALDAKSLERPVATLVRQRGAPRVHVTDANALPFELLRHRPPEPNLLAIRKALADGPVPGAVLSNGPDIIAIKSA